LSVWGRVIAAPIPGPSPAMRGRENEEQGDRRQFPPLPRSGGGGLGRGPSREGDVWEGGG